MAALKGGIGVGAIVSSRKKVSVVRGPPAAARRLAHGPTVASPIARRCPHAARRAVAAVLGGHKLSIGSKCPGPMARAVKAEARPPAADEARQPAEPTRPRARGTRQYESHQEARAARASYAVAGLLAELPDTAADRLLGKRAARQVPDARRRRELAVVLLRRKAGPKGDQARKALRAWRLLQAAAAARALPAQGLPASAALGWPTSCEQSCSARSERRRAPKAGARLGAPSAMASCGCRRWRSCPSKQIAAWLRLQPPRGAGRGAEPDSTRRLAADRGAVRFRGGGG